MNRKERKKVDILTEEFRNRVDELFEIYRMQIVKMLENEEEKAERLDDYFPDSSQVEAIRDGIDELEEMLDNFEEAVDMIREG